MSPTSEATSKPFDIYVRVSRVGGRSGDGFISPEVQEAKCRAFAAMKDYRVGEVITDLDQSGGKMERPKFEEALARIRSGSSGGIIVAKLDRFARNVRGLLDTVDAMEKHGAAFACVEPTIDTADPSFGRFLLTLFGGLAELELGRIRSGWSDAHDRHIAKGRTSGAAPVGYAKGADKRLVVNGYADQIREAFRLRAEGAGCSEVAAYLTAEGVAAKTGKTEWRASTVRKLIANPAYLGEARFCTPGCEHGWVPVPEQDGVERCDKCNGVRNRKAHEPLVDEITFRRANATTGTRRTGGGSTGKLLGKGLVRCGTCGAGMSYGTTVRNGKSYEFLRCPAPTKGQKHAAINISVLEPYLVEQAQNRLPLIVAHARETGTADPALQEAVEQAEAGVDQVKGLRGSLPEGAYTAALADAEARLVAAQEALDSSARLGAFAVGEIAQVPGLDDVVAARRWLRFLLGEVTVHPGRAPLEQRVSLGSAGLA